MNIISHHKTCTRISRIMRKNADNLKIHEIRQIRVIRVPNLNYGTAVLVVEKLHTADQALHAPSVLQAITRQ